ncbi:MAG: Gfo/Idh/MocA family protein [Alphaproteobacteria bacterium]
MTRILCISLGSIGKRHLGNARDLLPDAKIAVWRQYTSPDGKLPDGADMLLASQQEAIDFAPDAVIVSSPASEHIKNALPFIQKNVPVFMEKPLADTAEDIDSFLDACKRSTGFIMVGYVLRFLPTLHAIRKLIHDEMMGTIYTAHIQVGQYLPDWRPDSDYREGVSAQKKLGGGALLELSHELDYATWLFGWPKSLLASCAKLSPLDIDVEDSAHVVLEYGDKNVVVQLDFLQRVANMAMQLVCEKGTLEVDLMNEQAWFITPEFPEGAELEYGSLQSGNEIYLRQFDLFFSKALMDYKPRYAETSDFNQWADIDHAASVLKLVDLAKKASKTGSRQSVDFKRAKAA